MTGLHLERQPGLGLRAGLESALRRDIRSGQLKPGTRLPPAREAAAELGVARNTIGAVYTQLVSEGYLVANRGSGTRVADGLRFTGTIAPTPASSEPRPLRYDLRPGRPDLDLFPHTAWLAANRRVLEGDMRDALGYGDPQGPRHARDTIAAYLARVRGTVLGADQVM